MIQEVGEPVEIDQLVMPKPLYPEYSNGEKILNLAYLGMLVKRKQEVVEDRRKKIKKVKKIRNFFKKRKIFECDLTDDTEDNQKFRLIHEELIVKEKDNFGKKEKIEE